MRYISPDEKLRIIRSGRTVQSYTQSNYDGNPKAKYVIKVVNYDFKLYWVELLKEEGKETKICDVSALS